MCVTSPPYFQLRDYHIEGQIGLEPTIDEYLKVLVCVFNEVHRVLRPDGSLWLNMGDSYSASGNGGHKKGTSFGGTFNHLGELLNKPRKTEGLRPKNLLGMPWRLAFALQESGWILRQDIIWHKTQPMPESVKDRCTKAHEYLFLLTKNERYYFDFEAFQEPVSGNAHSRGSGVNPKASYKTPDGWDTSKGPHGSIHRAGREKGKVLQPKSKQNESFSAAVSDVVSTRNRRSVWSIGSEPFSGAHFATFPKKLIEPCIMAGSRVGDLVLDPFMGSGTTAQVAQHLNREWVGCELNPDYLSMQEDRTQQSALQI